ncbi:MAG TPA: multiubiquitin domain-containing protein [Cytophagaceae bacterium]|jgi:hypothetical protein|nr:multiubiquitin domain-containing protein [Cytophagaceae bacterium]
MHEISVNNKLYPAIDGFITGAQIKEMANIPLNDIVVFQIAGSKSGIEINDNDFVDLGRIRAESFISRKS